MNSYLNFLSRNKLYTLIEAFGLSMALGFIILLLCYARTEFAVGQKDAINPRTYAVGAGHFVGMTIGTPDAFFEVSKPTSDIIRTSSNSSITS